MPPAKIKVRIVVISCPKCLHTQFRLWADMYECTRCDYFGPDNGWPRIMAIKGPDTTRHM